MGHGRDAHVPDGRAPTTSACRRRPSACAIQEQVNLTDHAYSESLRLLGTHRAALDRVAAALLERETLSRMS